MTTCLLTRAVLRVWGFLLIVSALGSAPQTLIALGGRAADEAGQYFSIITGVSFLSTLSVGLVLLIYSDRIARWLFPEEERLRFSLAAVHVQRLLFASLGVYFIVGGITGLAVAADLAVRKPEWVQNPMMSYVWENHRQGLISSLVQLIAGCVLLLGREGITRLWRTIHPMSGASGSNPEA